MGGSADAWSAGKPRRGGIAQDLADAVVELIASGYSKADAFAMTPRQINAHLEVLSRRRARELAGEIKATRLAYHGDKQAVESTLKELER